MAIPLIFAPIADHDIDAVIALWNRCDLVVPWNDPYRDIAFARGKPNSDVLVGKNDGQILGAVMVGHDGHRGNVYYVAVDPTAQGKGLGKQVMDAATDWLRAKGVWKLNIMVRATNTKVIGFYENIGATREDRAVLAQWLETPPAKA